MRSFRFFSVLMLFALSCDLGSGGGGSPSSITFTASPTQVTFANTLIQKSRTTTITIRNHGVRTGHLTQITGLSGAFTVTSPTSTPVSVPALSNTTVTVQYSPPSSGSFSDTMTITTDDPEHPNLNIVFDGTAYDLSTNSTTVPKMVAISRPVAMDNSRALVVTTGPDGILGNTDDLVVLLDFSASSVTSQDISIPGLSTPPTGINSSQALIVSSGADLTYKTTDDEIVLIDISTAIATTTSIPIAGLTDDEASRPSQISNSTACVVSTGPDLAFGGSDDLLTTIDLSSGISTTGLTVPNLSEKAASRPMPVFGSFAILIGSPGPDGIFLSAADDDAIYFCDSTSASPQTVGKLDPDRSQIVASALGRGILVAPGPNGTFGDADDRILAVQVDFGFTITSVTVAGILSIPVRISDNRYVVTTEGPDGTADTSDDTILVMEDQYVVGFSYTIGYLDSTLRSEPVTALDDGHFFVATTDDRVVYGQATSSSTLNSVTVGGLNGEASQPVRASSTSAFVSSAGSDTTFQTADDQLYYVDFSESPSISLPYTVAGLASDGRSRPVMISSTYGIVGTAGPTLTFTTADDAVVRIGPIP